MKSRIAAVFLFCLVFASGVVTGLLADHFLEGHSIRPLNFASQSRPHVIDLVRQDLQLSEDQTHQVESILDDASRQFNELHSEAQTVRLQAKERIRSILNDHQREKLEASMSKLQRLIAEKQ
jgi:capsule polysaccharide export protein KpsE/RkpR